MSERRNCEWIYTPEEIIEEHPEVVPHTFELCDRLFVWIEKYYNKYGVIINVVDELDLCPFCGNKIKRI
jgi:hypothetical protein